MMYMANFGAQFLRKRCSKLFADSNAQFHFDEIPYRTEIKSALIFNLFPFCMLMAKDLPL